MLFSAVHYPSDYGFILKKLASDGGSAGCARSCVGTDLEKKPTGVEGWRDLKAALKIIQEARERYVRNK